MAETIYNQIGKTYSKYRKADLRRVEAILTYLDLPYENTLCEIGAGTGNYGYAIAEQGYFAKCLEPSDVMRNQKKAHQNIEWIAGTAENIPLATASMDAVMAILAFHHFINPEKALQEMTRISKGNIVIFTFDPRDIVRPWFSDYFPELWEDTFNFFPPLAEVPEQIQNISKKHITTHVFKLPHDLQDYFAAAGWRRPEIYLDPIVRSCISGFAIADGTQIEKGVAALKLDLESGKWAKKHQHLKQQESMDLGYRFIVAS